MPRVWLGVLVIQVNVFVSFAETDRLLLNVFISLNVVDTAYLPRQSQFESDFVKRSGCKT
jgi:hypothetical protein